VQAGVSERPLSACGSAPRLDRTADSSTNQGAAGLAKQTSQWHVKGFGRRYNGPERGIQARIFEFLKVLEIDSHGIGRLLLGPPAGGP